MDDTVNNLKNNNIEFLQSNQIIDSSLHSKLNATVGMLWLDIEGTQVNYFLPFFKKFY
jgi:sensor domain CHASE-containing protein